MLTDEQLDGLERHAREHPSIPGAIAGVTTVALIDEVRRLRAVLAGRTSPPDDATIDLHARNDGSWLIGSPLGAVCHAAASDAVRDLAARHRRRPSNEWTWIALDDRGIPCLPPTAPQPAPNSAADPSAR
jgi:hypothetical protein